MNLQPLGPKPSALPSWAISRYMVRSKGFEPLTFWFVAKHSIQLSYERIGYVNFHFIKWWLRMESNHRHKDFQSSALPTELQSHMAVSTGIEPAIFCVTGRRVNHCTTKPLVAGVGFEPTTFGLWAQRATELLHPAINKILWRRKRDSNPCVAFTASRFSRPVPSTRLGYSSIIDGA